MFGHYRLSSAHQSSVFKLALKLSVCFFLDCRQQGLSHLGQDSGVLPVLNSFKLICC